MRWEDERYVRLYTRDTPDWLDLDWEARALFHELLRKVDRAGLMPFGKSGHRGVARVVNMPVEVVEKALPILIKDGCVAISDGSLFMPNFTVAQESHKSDRLKKAEQRERDRLAAADRVTTYKESPRVDTESPTVTESHGSSPGVTSGHGSSRLVTPCCAVPTHAVPEGCGEGPATLPGLSSTTQPGDEPDHDQRLPIAATEPGHGDVRHGGDAPVIAESATVPPGPVDAPRQRGRRSPAKASLPEGWEAPHSVVEWARSDLSVQMQEGTVLAEADKFRDHARASGRLAVDWTACFRTWLRKAREFNPSLPRALPRARGSGEVPPMNPELQRRYDESVARGEEVSLDLSLFGKIGRGGIVV